MKTINTLSCLAILVALTACSGAREEPAASVNTLYPNLSLSPPPAPIMEEKQINLSPRTDVWRGGYWSYTGQDFRWIPGHFMKRPEPTAAWSSDRWERRSFGWAFVPGYWY